MSEDVDGSTADDRTAGDPGVFAAALAAEIGEHGEVRPPWAAFPGRRYHPMGVAWKSGAGETHLRLWRAWAAEHFDRWGEADRVAYLARWTVQPRWLEWAARRAFRPPPGQVRAAWAEDRRATCWWVAKAELAGLGEAAEYVRQFDVIAA